MRCATRVIVPACSITKVESRAGSDYLKNIEQWRPTKFVQTPHGLTASRNPAHIAVASRFIGDILAPSYEAMIGAHAKGRLLDMGCGHVPLYSTYREVVSENICIDWENTLHGNPFLDQVVDLTGDLPFPIGSFDTVLLTDVLEHIPEPARVMSEIARVLLPGGKLILGVPFLYWVHEEPYDYHRYTRFALARLCDLSGLQVLELNPYGGLPEVLLDLTSKGIELLPRSFRTMIRPIHSAAAVLNKTPLARKLSRASRESFPLGYLLVARK